MIFLTILMIVVAFVELVVFFFLLREAHAIVHVKEETRLSYLASTATFVKADEQYQEARQMYAEATGLISKANTKKGVTTLDYN